MSTTQINPYSDYVEAFMEIAKKAQFIAKQIKENPQDQTYKQMAWSAYNLVNKASDIQNEASKMAVRLEGAKE